MAESETRSVPRTPEEPTADDVLGALTPCEPYTASEVAALFEETTRWTAQRRLETLVERGDVQKKKHSERRVSYWIQSE